MKKSHHPFLTGLLPVLTAALGLLSTSHSGAATIVWGTPTIISADTDVSTTGTLLYAFSMGGTAETSKAVNGVTFAPFIASGTSVTVGNVTLAAGSGFFIGNNAGFGLSANQFSLLSPAYQVLMKSGMADDNENTSMTLTLGGLTNGQLYQVEVWSNESESEVNLDTADAKTIYTATNAATLDNNNTNGGGGVGQWVTGTFTAVGATQTIAISSNTPGTLFPVFNAVELRSVPEPASCGLLGLGGLLLMARRRRN